MDRVSFDVLVPVLLCVVIAGVVDAACFEEDSPINSVGSNEDVCSNDPQILLGNILICVDVVHGEEGLPLVFAEGIDLLVYGCP